MLLLLLACGGKDNPDDSQVDETPVDDTAPAGIGPEGGTVDGSCGTFQVPAGALSEYVDFEVGPMDVTGPETHTAIGQACGVFPTGVALAEPGRLVLPIDEEALGAEIGDLRVLVEEPGGWRQTLLSDRPSEGQATVFVDVTGVFLRVTPTRDAFCEEEELALEFCIFSLMELYQDKKGEGDEEAPEGWKPLPESGTGDGGIDWLFCYASNYDLLGDGACGLVGCFGDGLWDSQIDAIKEECKDEEGVAKLLCAGRAVEDILDDDESNVCRHHAWALKAVLNSMGYSANFECGSKENSDGDSVGHAWVEVVVDGNRYLLDSYNDIYVCVE